MSTPTVPRGSYPKVRRIVFPFGKPAPMERYYADNSVVFSHLFAMLSFGFPPGEEIFIRSVRRYADQITDPGLKKRVAGFIGQEAVHGQQHRELNLKLIEMGYSAGNFMEWGGKLLEKWEDGAVKRLKFMRPVFLAGTAAAEHGTATFARRILTSEQAQAMLRAGDPEVMHLLNWHTLEELEHKSVAHDVYLAVGGPEWLRRLAGAVVAYGLLPLWTLGTLLSILLTDRGALLHPIRLIRETRKLFASDFMQGVIGELALYTKRGFHPDDIDTNELLEKWSAQLFGEHGALVGHLK
ncbi:metal-dependent hydrolase [Segniliparus rugosus]|uniref:Metal-dependent hydrolase n=1 Tax=Segniliparus rugosus (strain ATCC BAA-974 / DSM 45345 / CCUG 50838 / CIP 108380 / JCM 13579 / CDC 945) TaxID=679197 RepID=E5XP03_SEGRC|nr:metal-dependent hydrolase [Segniliparus rugosus]EFV13895.1 hypothetical protein HMPREF9336_01224 [Segniliparus rugosus ATCC BAA-974]